MRRLVLTCLVLAGLALPAAATARGVERGASGDGTLVIRNADNGDGIAKSPDVRPVVTLVVTGFVIGRVSHEGRIDIFDTDPTDQGTPEVSGAGQGTNVSYTTSDGRQVSGTEWVGNNFRFRAVNGTFRVVIYGSGVYVFAAGQGRVWMTGNPDDPKNDGTYSFNGNDTWTSLPRNTPQSQPYILGG